MAKVCLPGCIRAGHHTALQVKRVDSSDLSLPTGMCYSILSYAIHFRDLLQDGDITAPSLASSGAVLELALEIAMSGENMPKICPQAWPSPPWMPPERG